MTEFFIGRRKLSSSFVSITQSYFMVPSTHFFLTKISNKGELQQIVQIDSSEINFKDFIKIYKKCTAEPYSFKLKMLCLRHIIHYEKKIFKNKYIIKSRSD